MRSDFRAAQRSLVADTLLCCVPVGWLAGIQERDALSHRVGELEQLTTTTVEAENAQLRVDNAALLEHLAAATASAAAAAQAPRTPHANYE